MCRELTKTYEEVRRGGLGELAGWAADGVRGEVTVVLAGAAPTTPLGVDELVPGVLELTGHGRALKEAVGVVAGAHGVSRRELYEAVLRERR